MTITRRPPRSLTAASSPLCRSRTTPIPQKADAERERSKSRTTTIAAKALRRDCRSAEFARYMFSTPMGATYARPMPSPCARGRMMIGSMSVSCPCSLPVSYVPASVVLGRDDADAPRRWAVLQFRAYP
ncbi:hypothetical protein BMIN_0642 [Bifidobacterium minimum]|uniref:Uncharacterized protein n=1 Tax=Bifidobacterium minimum TaxID=1693 RepID=A0A087BQE5_9BIFI|nr:hypothetical protein BMIN_0642 [Bifidobacterium minimum]